MMQASQRTRRCAALLLAAALLLTSCGGGAKATAMHLRRTEGKVGVSDGGGKDLEPRDDLGLYSGYEVDTRSDSYAWIDLDEVKLTKMDEDSEIEIQKNGKDLEIIVNEGSLFFNVTEPLADDETMTIRSSSMAVGIRGTCGWVEVPDEGTMKVYLLEGKVRCEADGEKKTVRAGEMAVMTEDGDITVEKFTAGDVPAFVAEEVEDDDDLAEAILDDSGIDVTGGGGASAGDLGDYADVLERIKAEYEILHTEILDFEGDGKPELLVIKNSLFVDDDYITIEIWRKGTPENSLAGASASSYNVNGIGITSLVEYGGRLFLKIQRTRTFPSSPGFFSTTTDYLGSVAQEEGSREDWGWVDIFNCSQYESGAHYSRYLHDERGFTGVDSEELTAAEYAAAQAQYKELKVLVYYTSEGGYSVLPDPSEIEEITVPETGTGTDEPDTGPGMDEPDGAPAVGFVSWEDAGLEDHVMSWGDLVLKQVVRNTLNIHDREVMLSDAWELTELKYVGDNGGRIKSISALKELKNLTTLNLSGNNISNISALRELTNLTNLDLSGNNIGTNISALSGLTNLTHLDLGAARIKNVSALSGLKNLTYLSLSYNSIEDVSPLSGLTKLTDLGLEGNSITDYSPVEFVQNLKK